MSSVSFISESHNQWRWMPLLTPAIKEDSCKVDYDLLQKRVNIIGLTSIVASVVAFILASAVFPAAMAFAPLSTLLLGLLPIDHWIAERAANVKAVNEYLTLSFPSKFATSRIQYNFKAAQLLINKNGDLNKVDEEGRGLLSTCDDLNIFKLLINHGADIKAIDRHGNSYFKNIVNNENPAFLGSSGFVGLPIQPMMFLVYEDDKAVA